MIGYLRVVFIRLAVIAVLFLAGVVSAELFETERVQPVDAHPTRVAKSTPKAVATSEFYDLFAVSPTPEAKPEEYRIVSVEWWNGYVTIVTDKGYLDVPVWEPRVGDCIVIVEGRSRRCDE